MDGTREGAKALGRIIDLLPAGAVTSIDAPLHDDGVWHLDVALDGVSDVVEYRPGRGYGLWSDIDSAYGERPDIVETEPSVAARRLVGIIASRGGAQPTVSP